MAEFLNSIRSGASSETDEVHGVSVLREVEEAAVEAGLTVEVGSMRRDWKGRIREEGEGKAADMMTQNTD